MGTIVTAVILTGTEGIAIRKMIRDKKSGKSFQCGCDCARCAGCGYKKA